MANVENRYICNLNNTNLKNADLDNADRLRQKI